MLRCALLLVVAFVLAACATAAQRQAEQIGTSIRTLETPTKACLAAVASDPDYAPLKVHFPIGDGQPTIEQMADPSLPTPEEVHLLSRLYNEAGNCFRNLAGGLVTAAPTLSQVILDGVSKADANALALAKGQENWGQFVTNKRQIGDALREALTETTTQLQRELAAEDQQEREQRQQAFEAAAQYFQNQQLIDSLNKPRYTNCTQLETVTNCRSY